MSPIRYDSSRIRTYDRLLRRQLLYPAELLSHERGGEQFVVPSYGFASQLSYYRRSWSGRQPSSAGASTSDSSDAVSSSADFDSGNSTPVPDKYSIAP